jgi:hypothetical protein
MCDYSLMSFPNRLATEGEQLVVYRFYSGSVGLASPADIDKTRKPAITGYRSLWVGLKEWLTADAARSVPAVCIPPAARLTLCNIPESFQSEYGVGKEEEVVFQQISAEAESYRDAVRFSNGRLVRLQELHAGQHVTVLDLGDSQIMHEGLSLEGTLPWTI